MARILRWRDFDIAGVQMTPEGRVIGFVSRTSLVRGAVRDHVQSITADLLISDATPLVGLLSVLRDREQIFVLVGPEVRGIVTRADLNKPPVRVYLFGLISLLEMHLGFWVRAAYPQDAWTQGLPRKRIEKAKKLQADRRARNQETTLLDCLQLCDKRDLLLAREDLRQNLCIGAVHEARAFLKRAEDLRNLLAHSQNDLVQGSSWVELIGLVQEIEILVQKSDELVEKEARRLAVDYRDGLWASA
jgi:hypothetical protein